MPKNDFQLLVCVAGFPKGIQLPLKPFFLMPERELSTFRNLSLNFVYKDNYILCLFLLLKYFFLLQLHHDCNLMWGIDRGIALSQCFPSEVLKALYKRGQCLDPYGETEPVIVQAAEPI